MRHPERCSASKGYESAFAVRDYAALAATVRATVRSVFEGDEANSIPPPSGRPIILVHGFGTSSRVLLPLERHLRRTLRRPVVRMRFGERVPLHVQDIRVSAHRVHAVLQEIAKHPGFEYADIVGHSMGGLVATYVLKRLDRKRRIRRVVTLGTPHRGTPLAFLGVLLFGTLTRSVWQMLPGSALLRELEELPVPAGSHVLSISALGDSVVPPTCARVADHPQQENDCLPHLDHFELVHSAAAFDAVARALADHSQAVWEGGREAA